MIARQNASCIDLPSQILEEKEDYKLIHEDQHSLIKRSILNWVARHNRKKPLHLLAKKKFQLWINNLFSWENCIGESIGTEKTLHAFG